MKKSLVILLMGASMLAASVTPANAATPAPGYNYSMNGAFSDSVGTSTLSGAATCNSPDPSDWCNIEASFGSDSNGNYWHWRTTQVHGGGAVLDTAAPLGNTYSLYFKFAIDDPANDSDAQDCAIEEINYGKILHFADLTNDVGLYTQGCESLFISTGYETGTASIAEGDVVEVVLTRDDSTKQVTVFINYAGGYEESFVFDDTPGDFVAVSQGSGSRIRLFQDEGSDGTNEGIQEGRLYGMQAWPGTALTLAQLDDLVTVTADSNSGGNAGGDNLANTGGDSAVAAWALGLALVAGAGAFVLRRRTN